MKLSEAVFDQIRQQLPAVSLIGRYATLKKRGREYETCCPFLDHNDSTPSFKISPETNLFYCFGCKRGGDIFQFMQHMESMSFQESLSFLAREAGVEIGEIETNDSRDALLQLYAQVAALAVQQFRDKVGYTTNYLLERGVSEDMFDEFGFGFDAGNWYNQFKDSPVVEDSGLFIEKRDKLDGRFVIPFVDERGNVVGFSGTAKGAEPKYLNTKDTDVFKKTKFLYGLFQAQDEIKKKGWGIVVEGFFGCVGMHQFGFTNTVATCGSSLSLAQAKLLKRYCDKILIMYDGDSAGDAGVNDAFAALFEQGIELYVVQLPREFDPDKFLYTFGREKMIEVIQEATLWTDQIQNTADMAKKKQQIRFIQNVGDKMEVAENRQMFLQLAADQLGVDVKTIYTQRKSVSAVPSRWPQSMKERFNEVLLLAALLKSPKRQDITAELFSPEFRPLFEQVLSAQEDFSRLYQNLSPDEAEKMSWIYGLTQEGVSVDSVVRTVRKERYQNQVSFLLEQIKTAEQENKDVQLLRNDLNELLKQKEMFK